MKHAKNGKEKGFIISFEAIIALLVFAVLIGTSVFYLEQSVPEARNSLLLKETASDTLTVLDKTTILQDAIDNRSSLGINSFFARLPYNKCAEVIIYNESDLNTAILSVLRQDCEKTFDELATVKRGFFIESNGNLDFYIAELNMWVRETA